MDDKLYMINFKVEDLDKLKEKIDGPDEDPDGDPKDGDEGDNGQEEGKENISTGDKTLDFEPGTGEEGDNSDKSANQDPTNTQKTAARTQSMRRSLLFLEEKEGQGPNFQSCVDLLSAMELHDSDEESDLLDTDKADEEKMIHLPTEWQFPDFNLITPFAVDGTEESHPSSEVTTSDQLGPEERGPTTKEIKNLQKASNEKPAEKKKWGPIEAERKSKRGTNDGRSVLEKAQDAKRWWSEGITKEYSLARFEATALESGKAYAELANSVSSASTGRPSKLHYNHQRNGKKPGETNEWDFLKTIQQEPAGKVLSDGTLSMKAWSLQLNEMEQALIST